MLWLFFFPPSLQPPLISFPPPRPASSTPSSHAVPCPFCRSLQSLDEDCTLEEEDEGLIEEEDEIDQFNDDTFGAGAIGESRVKYI